MSTPWLAFLVLAVAAIWLVVLVLDHRAAGFKILRAMRIAGVFDDHWMWGNDLRIISGVDRGTFYVAMNELEERCLVARRVADQSVQHWPPRGAAEFTMTARGLDASYRA